MGSWLSAVEPGRLVPTPAAGKVVRRTGAGCRLAEGDLWPTVTNMLGHPPLRILLTALMTQGPSLGCRSVQRSVFHPLVPALFTYSDSLQELGPCQGVQATEECNLVTVNLQGLLGRNLLLPSAPSPILTNSVETTPQENIILTKETEEGVEYLFQPGSVSTLTYSSSAGPVVFVVRDGQVFGSLSWKGARFSLQPCPLSSLKLGKGSPDNCHLWIRKKTKESGLLNKMLKTDIV